MKLIFATLCLLVFGCASSMSAPSGTIDVPCLVAISSGRLDVTFKNEGKTAQEFLVADGMPPYELDRVRRDGTVVMRAFFVCPLEWVHDCFHAESVVLEPGESRTFTFEWALPDELKRLDGETHAAIYLTYRERPETSP